MFSITPDKIMLGAKESTTFLIQALATKPGVVSEGLSCMATATGGAKGSNKVGRYMVVYMDQQVRTAM